MNSIALDMPEALASCHSPKAHAILGCPRNVAGNQTKTGSQVVSLHHVASHRAEISSAQNCPQPELGKDAEIDVN